MTKTTDVLDTPEIRRHTQRILALKDEEGKAKEELAYVTADIGDELIATKAALTKAGEFKEWLRWLSSHVNFTRFEAANYMRVARLRSRCVNVLGMGTWLHPTAKLRRETHRNMGGTYPLVEEIRLSRRKQVEVSAHA